MRGLLAFVLIANFVGKVENRSVRTAMEMRSAALASDGAIESRSTLDEPAHGGGMTVQAAGVVGTDPIARIVPGAEN